MADRKRKLESEESDQVPVCGTCPDIPYNIATYFCTDCKENICSDCSTVMVLSD